MKTTLKELQRCGGGFDATPSALMNLWGRFPRVGAPRLSGADRQPWADGFESRWDSRTLRSFAWLKNKAKSGNLASSRMTYLFVDTNVLLHYRRIEEIDWLNLSNSTEVVIVLCPAVIRELDHHKVSHPQNKFRQRAQAIITSFYSRLSGAESDLIRNGVRLEFLAEDPDLDFGKHKLRTELADDWIIASILEWRQKHPSDQTIIVSADLGVSIKAKAQKIPALAPLEADKLAEELDADEKRIKKLQEELAEAKSALPNLKLCFADGQNIFRVKMQPPTTLDTNQLDTSLQQIHAKHPLLELPPEPPKKASSNREMFKAVFEMEKQIRQGKFPKREPSRWDFEQCNSKLEDFYKLYEQYFRRLHDFQNVQRRTIQFVVALNNVGTSPGEDIDIHIHFPDGFWVFDADKNLPDPPVPPKAPAPVGTYEYNPLAIGALSHIGVQNRIQPQPGPPPNVSSPSIRRTNSYDVRSQVKKAKHGYIMRIAAFGCAFDSYESAKSFQIDYSVTAANSPKASAGKLSVVIEKHEQS